MFSDVTSFAVNLSQRRDASFFLCGEVCRFIHKLCFRCYTPDTAPLENAWFVLLALKTSEGKYMSVDEFLIRQKLTLKVNTASKQKTEGIHSGIDASPSVIQKAADAVKSNFVTSAFQYIGYLLDTTLRQSGLNSDIVISPTSRTQIFVSKIILRYFGHDNIILLFGGFFASFSFVEFPPEKISSFLSPSSIFGRDFS